MANAPAASGAPANAQQVMPAPFRVGVQRTASTDGYTNTTTMGSTSTDLPVYEPSPNAFLRGVWVICTATTSGNTASAAFQGDAPLNAYSTVSFNDSNQKPIIGPFDSYTLALINKYGGYQSNGDPRNSVSYSATTGTGATGGSFSFVLYVPLEVASRDAMGALENKSTAQPFSLNLTLNTEANVYSTSPTTAPSVKTQIVEDGWWQPKAATASGQPLSQTPPASGSTQYWVRGSYSALNGAVQTQISQGLGYPIRNYLFVNYATGAARSGADFPDPAQIIYKGTSVWNVPQVFWKDQMVRTYGLSGTTYDAANGLDTGVFVLPFNQDFALVPGDELRNGYLVTQQGDQFQLVGTFSASSQLYAVCNYVAPGNGNPDSLRASR